MFELECMTKEVFHNSNYDCAPDHDTCNPEYDLCGPDYGVSCMPQCDPADD